MALDILVNEFPEEIKKGGTNDEKLVSWVIDHVKQWEDYRCTNFEDAWKEYYQQWKAIWTKSGKTRESERSKFISPALAQAIEMAVADMEEATFNKRYWIDIDDDLADEQKADIRPIRNQLIEDMELAGVVSAVSEVYLNGSIYGTGIGKVVVSEIDEILTNEVGEQSTITRVQCELEPISPEDFAIDPSARNVNEGLGCAHIVKKSKTDIKRKQEEGIYKEGDLGDFIDDDDVASKGESKSPFVGNNTKITEYHGLVPAAYILKVTSEAEEAVLDLDEDIDMVESIVTIANDQVLLKSVPNPFLYRDRSVIAYQHDTVPNRFWGRGVAEKGIHSQRALNAELRARQDGLAMTIHPMMAMDATRIPRGFKPRVAPGATLLTNGDPRATFMPMHFGDMGTHTYREGAELERMMQMATGSMDSATPIGVSPRNQTASGMSMISAGSIKRNKRTMRNIEEDFLKPMINKFSWRYQQFDPERYPFGDYKLIPYSTMGIMAREFEQGQIAQVMQTVPQSPAMGVLLKAFIDNSSIPAKQELQAAIDQTFAPPPPDPMQQQIQQLQLQNAALENEKLVKEIAKLESETVENYAQAEAKVGQTQINQFNAIAQTEDNELDRTAFGRKDAE